MVNKIKRYKTKLSNKGATMVKMKSIKIWMVIIAVLVMAVNLNAGNIPSAARVWNYNIITANISKDFGIIAIPGFKYEFLKYVNEKRVTSKGALAYEFFIGPYIKTHIGKVKVMIPVVYHYMGFPNTPTDTDFSYNHNIDIFSSFLYKHKKSIFQWRIFFHNTFYSTLYKYMPITQESKGGYSLLLKLRARYSYWVSKKVALSFGDEVLYGIIENSGIPAKTGPGFTESGFDANRLMGGIMLRINKNLTISPYYLYETTYAKNKTTSKKELTSRSHYLFLLIKYNFKL